MFKTPEGRKDYDWITPDLEKDSHYVLCNRNRAMIQINEQIFKTYGMRSNDDLLVQYGFCFLNNCYESYRLFLPIDLDLTIAGPIDPTSMLIFVDYMGQDLSGLELVNLSRDMLSDKLLAYLRLKLFLKYVQNLGAGAANVPESIPLTTVSNFGFEKSVM